MKIVLDSNVFLFFLHGQSQFINQVLDLKDVEICIPTIILEEVLRNLNKEDQKRFFRLLSNHRFVVKQDRLTKELIEKYELKGFKKGDALVAAFCEHIGADLLVSENRHFIKASDVDFKVVSEEEFIQN